LGSGRGMFWAPGCPPNALPVAEKCGAGQVYPLYGGGVAAGVLHVLPPPPRADV
jgi:hypothetical protein